MTLRVLIPLLLSLCIGTAHSESLSGHPRVVDADTLAFDLERVRIEGIDAPEAQQTCRDAAGKEYPCGEVATAALRAQIGSDRVTCTGDSRDRYGRLIGGCLFTDGIDLNGWVVRQGHALAYRTYSLAYVDAENAAEAQGLGIWAGEFVPPWAWRRGERLPLAD